MNRTLREPTHGREKRILLAVAVAALGLAFVTLFAWAGWLPGVGEQSGDSVFWQPAIDAAFTIIPSALVAAVAGALASAACRPRTKRGVVAAVVVICIAVTFAALIAFVLRAFPVH